MNSHELREPGSDRSVAMFILSAALLISPSLRWWAAAGNPWWLVFALWGLLILLCAWSSHVSDHDS